MADYRYYLDVNGNEEYFEWRDATAGGVVFDLIRSVSRPSSAYDHLAVLAYDLRQVSNPSVTNMYYSYWGQNMGTVYRETDQDVYIIYSNLTCLDSDNPRRYDVQLESDNRYWTTMCADIRAYWDAQGGVENLYVGVNGKAQQVKKLYVGVNGLAREVKAIYVGVNGKARKVF